MKAGRKMGWDTRIVNVYRPVQNRHCRPTPGKERERKDMFRRFFPIAAHGLLLSLLLPAVAGAQAPSPSTSAPAVPGPASSQPKQSSLVVLNARKAALIGHTLALDGVTASAIVFADRPIRRAGYIHMDDLLKLWSSGSFAKDPPNGTVSAFAADGTQLNDLVVVLKSPKRGHGAIGDTLTFDVTVLEGDLGQAKGPAAVFIDTIWFGIGSGGVHYLGQNRTTGGTTPSVSDPASTSTSGGWPNPAPNGPPDRTAPAGPPPLTTPPGMNR